MRPRFIPAILIAAMLVGPAAAQEAARTPTITLQGVGEIAAEPDMAVLTSGVITQSETAREALNLNNLAAGKLLSLLTDMGISERDMQTSNFSIQPLYERNNNGNIRRDPKIIGYQVSNQVTVRIRDLEMIGEVLDEVVTNGANSIDGLSFSVSEPDGLIDDARRAAVADALAKAELYAEAAGVTLGPILEITENSYGQPQAEMLTMARMSADAVSVPIASGEVSYSSNVNIVWQIVQD